MPEYIQTWGHNLLSPNDRDLPGLKFRYLYEFLEWKTGNILEIGCGSGKNLRSVHNYYPQFQLSGIDIDERAIREWQRNYPFISFTSWSGEAMPLQDEKFDIIIISDYLEHVDDINKALSELKRVVKPGWYIHAFIPCEGEPWYIYWIFKKIFWFNVKETGGHTQFFTKKWITNELEKKWFNIMDAKYSYHFLGQFLDFWLFSLLLNKNIAKLWWEKNKYYHDKKKEKSSFISEVFNGILTIGNYLAYMESSFFKKTSFWAMWVHFILKDNR